MKVVYHPAVQRDINAILRYYDKISPRLGEAFWDEFMLFVAAAAQNPARYRMATPTLRRVNLRRFPHHFLFRDIPGGIRIVILRHHRSHPQRGLERR